MWAVPERRWSFPTRDQLRLISRWVWLLLALAVALAALLVYSATTVALDIVYWAIVSTAPLLVAAALMFAAPRERLVAVAAFGFAALPALRVVELAFMSRILLPPNMSEVGYVSLAQRVSELTDTAASFGWVLTLAAVLCLAFQIGIVRSRTGMLIIGIGVILAAGHAFVTWTTLLPPDLTLPPDMWPQPLPELVISIVAALGVVGWAYLTAVALDRRLLILAPAGGMVLVLSAMSLGEFGAVRLLPPDESLLNTISLGFGELFRWLHLAQWGLLIAGILLELPRHRSVHATSSPIYEEAYSAGR